MLAIASRDRELPDACAGCYGAGETTFAKEFLPSIGVIQFLNADEIALRQRGLPMIIWKDGKVREVPA